MRIDICLPVYNEEKIIEKNTLITFDFFTKQSLPYDWRIILLVNGSTDMTLSLAKKMTDSHPGRINYVHYEQGGKGGALKSYFQASTADIICFMDIDLAVNLKCFPALVAPLLDGQADITMGSRMLPGSIIDRSLWREFNSQLYAFISRVVLGHNFSDLQCGFKAFQAKTIKNIMGQVRDNKWFFDTEMIVLAKMSGARIIEVPVDWSENRYEQRESKVSFWKNSPEFILKLFDLKKRIIKKPGE